MGLPARDAEAQGLGLDQQVVVERVNSIVREVVGVKAMASSEPTRQVESLTAEEWSARLRRLQEALAVCPTDILARCELASLLEELGQPEEALFNWKAALACDPNNLKAWEGLARCRQPTSRSLHSNM